jgi:hypothetical protein
MLSLVMFRYIDKNWLLKSRLYNLLKTGCQKIQFLADNRFLEVVVVGFGSGCDSFWKWLLLVLEVVVIHFGSGCCWFWKWL